MSTVTLLLKTGRYVVEEEPGTKVRKFIIRDGQGTIVKEKEFDDSRNAQLYREIIKEIDRVVSDQQKDNLIEEYLMKVR